MGTKGLLPEGYRPPTDIIGFGYIRGTNTSGQILVNSAGEVETWCTQNNTRYFSGSVCFVVEQHSVSQPPIEVAKTSGSTSYESFKVDLPTTKMGCLIVVYNNRPLCSTAFPISHFIKNNTSASDCVDCYYVSEISLHATAYYQNGYLYLQSGNRAVRATFVVF